MNTCISSYCFHSDFENGRLKTLQFPRFCREEFGVGKIEFFDPDFFFEDQEVGNIAGLSVDAPYLRRVSQACREAKSTIVAISAQNDFSDPDDAVRRRDMERVKHWIRAAAALRTMEIEQAADDKERAEAKKPKIVRINSGIWFCDPEDDGVPRLRKALEEIGPEAQRHGVLLAVENHPPNLRSVEEAKKLAQIAADLEHFGVRTCPDVGHIEPQVRWECLRVLLPSAAHFHAKFYEFDARGEESSLRYEKILEEARQADYEGAISIELILPPGVEQPLWLRITADTLEKVREFGVPPDALSRLAGLAGRNFSTPADLNEAVKGSLGDQATPELATVLLRHVERLDPGFERRKESIAKAVEVLRRYG